MDFNGDGRRDILSGSYPGELYFFSGDGEVGFRAPEKLKYANGKEIKIESASVVYAVDWEDDGDLDLVVGDIKGRVHLVLNGSGGIAHEFGKARALTAGGAPIQVAGGNSGPVVADWDGDGKHDLVVGCGDGGVLFFRNLAEDGAPQLGKPEILLGPSAQHRGGTAAGQTSPGGYRAKVAVADFDADGKLDLLVGDFASRPAVQPNLTAEQIARRDELKTRADALAPKMQTAWVRVQAKLLEELGIPENAPYPELTPEQQKEFSKRITEMYQTDRTLRALQAVQRKIHTELSQYQARPQLAGNVWLYLRE